MRINLRYQIVLFSDFMKVQDDTKTRETFLECWKSYDFRLKPLIEASLGPAGISNQSRPSFSTADGSFSVNIHSDQVVMEALNTDINVFKMPSMAEFMDRVFDICSKSNLLSSQRYKRVGMIRQVFYKDIDINRAYKRFCNGIKFYDNLEMNDWSIFFPAHKVIANSRIINATSRIDHVKTMVKMDSMNKPFDGIASITDVNTLATNRVDNISWEEMRMIIKDLQKIEYEITNQTADAIEEDK